MIYTLSRLSPIIEKWNEKLNSFFSKNFDSPFFGTVALVVLFAFGCWIISYLNKK